MAASKVEIVNIGEKVVLNYRDIEMTGKKTKNDFIQFQGKDITATTFEDLLGPLNNICYNHLDNETYFEYYLSTELESKTTIPFSFLYLYRENDQFIVRLKGFYNTFHPIKNWSYEYFINEFMIVCEEGEYKGVFEIPKDGDNQFFIDIYFTLGFTDRNLIKYAVEITIKVLNSLIEKTILKINGFTWESEYEKNEDLFCKEVLSPLLAKIGFTNVEYIGGIDEYGRDFIFNDSDKLGNKINFGLQAKKGDISGNANSKLNDIINQIDDAFKMPYKELGKTENQYLHYLIIATSGNYSRQAKEKIINKVSPEYRRYVEFWDKTKILSLINQHWTDKIKSVENKVQNDYAP